MSTPRSTTTTALVVAGAAVLGGAVAYAVYFDYKRRNNVEFRKQLRKEHKRVKRAKVESAAAEAAQSAVSDDDMRAALESLRQEPLPATNQERENFFTQYIANGEQLSLQGPTFHLESALEFYRALRIYPQPVELLMIYQKTVPPVIFEMVMKLTTLDVKDRGEGYYNHFPSPSMNVAVKQVRSNDSEGNPMLKNILVATKDFAVGDVIYTEFPMAAALDGDLEGTDTYCSQCMRVLTGKIFRIDDDPMKSAYCSEECRKMARQLYHDFLFGLGPLVFVDPIPPPPAPRRAAQTNVAELLRTTGDTRSLLAMRLFAHQIMRDAEKRLAAVIPIEQPLPASNMPESVGEAGSQYTFADHVERLRYLEGQAPAVEYAAVHKLFDTALGSSVDGSDFIPDERYNVLRGKIAYNAIGVTFGDGRADKKLVLPTNVAESRGTDIQWARTPTGVDHQIGSAIYRVSSYLTHSCTPSVRPTFAKGTYELHLVATRSISAGEELTMAYVDVSRKEDEPVHACWLRRCAQLSAGWHFVCRCARCMEERPKVATEQVPHAQDGAKVEEVVKRFEEAASA